MSANTAELALRLDDAVRAVPGVVALFSADAALVRATRELTASVAPAMVSIRETDDGLQVVVSVGMNTDRQVPETTRAVSDAIRDTVGGVPIAELVVRVSRITA